MAAACTPPADTLAPVQKKSLAQLYSEPDAALRAKLALDIQQQIIDDEAMGFMAILNKITVMRAGVVNCKEANPISFYFLSADTDITE